MADKRSLEQWYCSSCKANNDILSTQCQYYFSLCQTYRPSPLARFAGWIALRRDGSVVELTVPKIGVTTTKMRLNEEQVKELHAQFFNNEATTVVPDMDLAQLDEHIHTLEMIAFEAKVRLQAATENKRSRVAKLRLSEREKLVSNPDITGTDALNAVTKRKERLTKADKIAQSLKKLGLDDAAIREIASRTAATISEKPRPAEQKIQPVEKVETPKEHQDQLVKEAVELVTGKVENEKPKLSFFKFGS